MRRVRLRRNIPVPMPDGVTLLADHYAPPHGRPAPAVLIRSPYGRRGLFGLMYGRGFARHGFHVLIQSCRGGFGSGGDLDPLGDEHDDGLATVAWLHEQPWYGGSFAMFGPSYLGYAQWAIAADAGAELKAMATQITASQFRDAAYVGGAFALESALSWTTLTDTMSRRFVGGAAVLTAPRATRRAVLSGRPVAELDLATAGRPLRFFRDLLAHHADPAVPYWDKRDFSPRVGEVEAAVTMLGGWYDVFLPWQLKDYAAMRAAGRRPYLTIGPWYHVDSRHGRPAMADALAWFRAHLLDDRSALRRDPVRLYVTGAEEWRDHPDWPVPGMREQRWHLRPGGGLAPEPPDEAGSPPWARDPGSDRFRYHPAHPTPVIGGPVLLADSRPRDQRRLEARRDVLVYSSPPLKSDLEMIGPVHADLYVRSSTPYVDVVARVCDVQPDGRSLNLCEGVRRLTGADGDGVRRVRVELWPIGHRFRRGHRIRLHVAAGAYPTIARNPGTGDPLGAAGGTMVPADVEVFRSPGRPSAVVLPLCAPRG